MKFEAANTIVNGSVAPADDLKYSTVAVTSVDVCSTIAGIVVKYPAAACTAHSTPRRDSRGRNSTVAAFLRHITAANVQSRPDR